ncbi:MAG: ion channel [Bacteroidota bacterium]
MSELLYKRRFTLFLTSFLLLLFGSIAVPPKLHADIELIFLLLNMVCSYLLFVRSKNREKTFIIMIIFFGILSRLNQEYMESNIPYLFTLVYLMYFGIISYRLFSDLMKQNVVGIETISGAFTGFILMGVFFSIVFLTLQVTFPGAFKGFTDEIVFADFLYFSFITLLTIGYGDITPTMELSRKLVVLVGLLGNFYTVFITAIVIGKFLSNRKV